MTVPSDTNHSGPYSGNGSTTVFGYGFRVVSEDHIRVIKTSVDGAEADLTLATDYTVDGVGDDGGGSVTTLVAPGASEKITLVRNIPFVQETDLENQGAYYAETVEDALDLAVMRDQQLQEQVNRSVKVPASYGEDDLESLTANIILLADNIDDIVAANRSVEDAVAQVIEDLGLERKLKIHEEIVAGNAARDLADFFNLKQSLRDSGALNVTSAGGSEYSPFALEQIENWRKNIEQVSQFVTLPLADVPGARARSPEMRPSGVPITGPVYSSARTRGSAVGQDNTIRNYISMMRNPNSAQYSTDLEAEGFPYGRAYSGAVCSNILRGPFGWAYTPTTKLIAHNLSFWGFTDATLDYRVETTRVGDCFITWPNGGHIEAVYDKTDTHITLFDQTFDGPDYQEYTYAEFLSYVRSRDYIRIRFDYENNQIDYTPDPFSPIRGEIAAAFTHDDVVTTEYGFGKNYRVDEDILININSTDVTDFTIKRDGVVIETGSTSGGETLTRSYSTAGDYEVSCTMTDTSESVASEFQVGKMEGSLSTVSTAAGDPVTFTLDFENCVPSVLLLEDQATYSISNGFIHEITDAERSAGEVVFTHDRPGDWRVRPQGQHKGGTVYPALLDNYEITLT